MGSNKSTDLLGVMLHELAKLICQIRFSKNIFREFVDRLTVIQAKVDLFLGAAYSSFVAVSFENRRVLTV